MVREKEREPGNNKGRKKEGKGPTFGRESQFWNHSSIVTIGNVGIRCNYEVER